MLLVYETTNMYLSVCLWSLSLHSWHKTEQNQQNRNSHLGTCEVCFQVMVTSQLKIITMFWYGFGQPVDKHQFCFIELFVFVLWLMGSYSCWVVTLLYYIFWIPDSCQIYNLWISLPFCILSFHGSYTVLWCTKSNK